MIAASHAPEQHRPARRLPRAALLVGLLATLLVGCSLRKLAYSYADRLLVSSIDDTFDLTRAQKAFVQERVRGALRWHQRDELPRYAAMLSNLEQALQDGLSEAEVRALSSEVEGALRRLAPLLSDAAGPLLAGLSEQQIAHADGAIAKDTEERFRALKLEPAAYERERLGRARKQLKTWLGEARPEQLQLCSDFIRAGRPHEELRHQIAEENRRQLIAALRRRPGAEALRQLVRRWAETQQIEADPRFQRMEEEGRARFSTFLLALDRSLTAEQRRHLIAELAGWRRDFGELADEARRRSPQ